MATHRDLFCSVPFPGTLRLVVSSAVYYSSLSPVPQSCPYDSSRSRTIPSRRLVGLRFPSQRPSCARAALGLVGGHTKGPSECARESCWEAQTFSFKLYPTPLRDVLGQLMNANRVTGHRPVHTFTPVHGVALLTDLPYMQR